MIEVKNIHYSVGNAKLIDDVSFDVRPGQLVAIIGANGAGKSTLLRLLCKEIPAARGDIYIRQQPIETYKLEELAKFRAVLAQSNTLSISFSVRELVMMGRYPHFANNPTEDDVRMVKTVMDETGITEFADRDYHTLSGGEQQRVQLARVIAQIYDQPEGILLLDEPTNGLDLLYQQQMLSLARNLANRGYCVVSILHDINFASRYADKVLILKKGKRIAFGKPREVVTCENIHQAFNIRVRLLDDEEFKCPLVIPSMTLSEQAVIKNNI
ncbi:heme ABC transporter ATP-binding protein [Parapedobacter sp. DT-150]|uniref:heme ABC transporter ATP-binding protein n=1 Tax=Parapedobacter sp. DT-150 TaxID=3396162 RepID=UPI003F19AE3E